MSLAAAAICLTLGAKTVALPTDHLTLAWRHSVEKSGWEEDYVLRGGRLVLKEARIEGTGAGMERRRMPFSAAAGGITCRAFRPCLRCGSPSRPIRRITACAGADTAAPWAKSSAPPARPRS